MKTFEARMRVVTSETWTVEAETATEALDKFAELADDVITDDCGETIDWEVLGKVKELYPRSSLDE
jgi:hypothetical protein